MEPEFWHERWSDGRIGFHQDQVHPALQKHVEWLSEGPHRVLVPLCGKTWDLDWLAKQGHAVTGVELSQTAAEAFHKEQGRVPTITEEGAYRVYRSANLEVLVGDVFELGERRFDRVWDRASMVALPSDLRAKYVATMKQVASGGRILLSTFCYDTSVMSGPPFSIPPDEVRAAYAEIDCIECDETVTPAFQKRGHSTFEKRLWLGSL